MSRLSILYGIQYLIFLTIQKVAVSVHRDADRAVSKPFRYLVHVDALVNQIRSVRMSEVMDTDIRQSALFDCFFFDAIDTG